MKTKTLLTITGMTACFLGILLVVMMLLLKGPLSQASQLKRYEKENLEAIQNAGLNVVTEFPDTDITNEEPYRPIPGFKAPWTVGDLLSLVHFSNGPIEGVPYKNCYGIIINKTVLIATHGWVDGKRWGIVYNPTHVSIPVPYWSTPITKDWEAWHLHYTSTPKEQGLWYK